MPQILSVGTAVPPHEVTQEVSRELSRIFFQSSFSDIDRLLGVFASSAIEKRHFCMPVEWFLDDHSFAEKNRLYIEHASQLCKQATQRCLQKCGVAPGDIDCLLFVSSTGISTPSMDARLINLLGLREEITRIPLWGLGCAGGAMGLSRAGEYAKAYPEALVLLISVELCGLTFVKSDRSKSNLIATSLFADGAAAVLIAGDGFPIGLNRSGSAAPRIVATKTTTWRDSLDVMGWDVTDDGLRVIFSRDIPSLIHQRMRQNTDDFLSRFELEVSSIRHFIPHPGGAKVLTAYQKALQLEQHHTRSAAEVLRQYGNMSSATVLFVLEKSLEQPWQQGERGLLTALGPGFSSECILLEAR